ncbi:hypothetical protein [Cecembia sp.]|uniref:hypothetical protein n=1 Tax=Cecembia sp. TaxID=1898110 RepID=UPI0025BCEDC1|nr:hypothetical protein [Cecembia sp.]
MKKIFTTLIAIILGFANTPSLFAQLQKGNLMVGGSLNFNRSNTEAFDFFSAASQDEIRTFTLNPRVGYFISDTWVVGLEGRFSSFNSKVEVMPPSPSTSVLEINDIGAGAFARKFFPIQEKLAFFGQFSTAFLSSNQENSIDQNNSTLVFESNVRRWDYQIGAGLAFFPTPWIAVELQVVPINFGFNWNESKSSGAPGWSTEISSSYFNVDLNTTSVFLGVNFFINRNK